jgi:hypothetical protein
MEAHNVWVEAGFLFIFFKFVAPVARACVRGSAHMPYLPQKNSVLHVSKSNNRGENLAKGLNS